MKYLYFFIPVICLLLPMNSFSQNTPLTLEDLIPGGKNYNKYRAEMPRQMNWYGDRLIYVKGDTVYYAPMKDGDKPDMFLTLSILNEGLSNTDVGSLKSLQGVRFTRSKGSNIYIYKADKIYVYDFVEKNIVATFKTGTDVINQSICKESLSFVYTKGNNIYIQNRDGIEKSVTSDTDKSIINGHAVHRNEFGIDKGIFMSPKGNLLTFTRMDESMVTDYPLVDMSARVAKLKDIKYPMAGMKSHHVTVGVYNPATEKTVFLKTGTPKEKYLTNIAWSPDEKSIYIAELNRGQDTCVLKRYDALTGKEETTLFTETHPKYVEPQNPVLFLKNDPSKFIWQSMRDGYNHLYLYDINGRLLKQLTKGEWEVSSIVGFDEKGENLFYVSTEVSPIERHVYKLNLKNGKKVQLSKEKGVHQAMLSASGKYIYDMYTSQNNPGKVAVTETKTNKTYMFHTAKNPYHNIELPEITLGTLKANDGKTDLYYRMVKPLNFDAQKRYPVIIYVYGGPHSQMVTDAWMGQVRGWDIYMAEKGYVVFTLDNRGTSNRGINFENITHRRLGVIETQDQMTGVDYLKSLPYVDADRIGVHGWSYGGFMTLNLMLRHPETFKVGVAGGPVTDWKYYEIMYGERYMDSPQDNNAGYFDTNMTLRAGDLKGRLLLIHGDEDPTVVMQHTSQFLKSAVKAGTHPDLFVYPGHGHNVMGRDRIHLHEHITRYFDDFLK